MAFTFGKAQRKKRKARIAIIGPTGAGKTLTAIKIAQAMCPPGKRVRLIDTENESGSLYVNTIEDGARLDYDAGTLSNHHPDRYIEAIDAIASDPATGVGIIDSLSHAWIGKDGVLALKEAYARMPRENDFSAWRHASPHHDRLVSALVNAPIDLIVCMRAKMAYEVQEKAGGKKEIVKLGLQAEQRQGLEYEFDVVFDVDSSHTLLASKTRCRALDGRPFPKAGAEVARIIRDWLDEADAPAEAGSDERAALAGALMTKIANASSIAELEAVGAEIGASRAGVTPAALEELRKNYDRAAELLAARASSPSAAPASSPASTSAPAATPAPAAAAEPLTPGVDVPAMDAGAAERAGNLVALRTRINAAPDLGELEVVPGTIKALAEIGKLEAAHVDELRAAYAAREDELRKAGKTCGTRHTGTATIATGKCSACGAAVAPEHLAAEAIENATDEAALLAVIPFLEKNKATIAPATVEELRALYVAKADALAKGARS